jgi:hypothetical protein
MWARGLTAVQAAAASANPVMGGDVKYFRQEWFRSTPWASTHRLQVDRLPVQAGATLCNTLPKLPSVHSPGTVQATQEAAPCRLYGVVEGQGEQLEAPEVLL